MLSLVTEKMSLVFVWENELTT